MKIIVGFGNPGNQYNFTRHNYGFLALDFYAKIKGFDWEKTEKNSAIWYRTKASSLGLNSDEDVIFIKPQTFYNDSGISTAAFMRFFKIPLENILILCDDFNIDFGTVRFREKGSAGGNNGLKSHIQHLGTENFPRLRLGTANDVVRRRIGDTDFVLGKFTPEEKEKLPNNLKEIAARIDEFILK